MIDPNIPGSEETLDLDVPLRRLDQLTFEEQARALKRVENLTRIGVIKPNAFDPFNRKRKWPNPVPRDA